MRNKLLACAVVVAAATFFETPASAGAIMCGNPAAVDTLQEGITNCTVMINQDTQLSENRAQYYYDRGLLYHQEGQYEQAVKDYTNALGWMRNFSDALAARGDAYEALGEHDKALTDYRDAEQFNEDGAGALNTRCWIRAVRGRPLQRALDDCNKALAESPDNFDFHDSRCFVRYRMGDYTGAISDCDAALDKRPELASSLYVRGLAKLKSGDSAGGTADIASAKDSFDRVAKFYSRLGVNP